ncbi:MAG: hypothetical protein KF767_17370 [Bdellovibrionaceae bacterium]|nr:hypothetical protein [Pseudobdellovibrionaceae bacterium]
MSKTENLFRVLVLGGALIAGPARAQSEVRSEAKNPTSAVEAMLALPEDQLAFCSRDDERSCEVDENGEARPQAGIECCWGTSCG